MANPELKQLVSEWLHLEAEMDNPNNSDERTESLSKRQYEVDKKIMECEAVDMADLHLKMIPLQEVFEEEGVHAKMIKSIERDTRLMVKRSYQDNVDSELAGYMPGSN
jgi:hypothetical protein